MKTKRTRGREREGGRERGKGKIKKGTCTVFYIEEKVTH